MRSSLLLLIGLMVALVSAQVTLPPSVAFVNADHAELAGTANYFGANIAFTGRDIYRAKYIV